MARSSVIDENSRSDAARLLFGQDADAGYLNRIDAKIHEIRKLEDQPLQVRLAEMRDEAAFLGDVVVAEAVLMCVLQDREPPRADASAA